MSVTVKRISHAVPVPPDTLEISMDFETAQAVFDVLGCVGGANGNGGSWSRRVYLTPVYQELEKAVPVWKLRMHQDDMEGQISFSDRLRP